jgi:hypothetical protein
MSPTEHLALPRPTSTSDHAAGPRVRSRAFARRVRHVVPAAVVVPWALLFLNESAAPMPARVVAATLWSLCLLPAWQYLGATRARRRPLPFLALIGLLYGLYYALPLAVGATHQHWLIRVDPAHDYDVPIVLAFAGWLCVLAGYGAISLLARSRVRPRADSPLVADVVKFWGFLLLYGMLTLGLIRQFYSLPGPVLSVLNQSYLFVWLGSALLAMLAARRLLAGIGMTMFILGAAGAAILQLLTTTLVSTVVFLGVVIVLGVWIGKGRLGRWGIALLGAAAISVLVLRASIKEFRAGIAAGGLSLTERAQLVADIVARRVTDGSTASQVAAGGSVVSSRSANLELFADVVRRTPDEVPYWGGRTYVSLIGVAIPRFLWPNKPRKELGGDFGHRYRYLQDWDRTTSVNLPFLVEFYANFGVWGVLAGMLLVGCLYRSLDQLVNRPGQDAVQSVIGMVLLMPLFNIESDFSLIFGGLILNGTAFWLIYGAMHSGSTRARAAARPRGTAPPRGRGMAPMTATTWDTLGKME